MEPQIEQQTASESLVAPRVPLKRRYAGAVVLLLLFLASAGATIAYLSGTGYLPRDTQTASAAEATTSDAFKTVTLQAESAFVLDLSNGRVLYSLNPDAQLPLASLAKVALALAVSEVLPPDSLITIPYGTAPTGSAQGLAKGQVLRERDLLNYTLIASLNDGADILAQAANDDIRAQYPRAPEAQATLWRMNDIARNLGLTRTFFLNDNGLDISTTQSGAYGSARDMANLFAYAATSAPGVFAGTTRGGLLITSTNGTQSSASNTDKALGAIPGLIMGKTGYTDLAGGNLGIVFDVGPAHPVVAIVLHSTQDARFDDMKMLVNATLKTVSESQ